MIPLEACMAIGAGVGSVIGAAMMARSLRKTNDFAEAAITPTTSQAMADVGYSHRRLPQEARAIIRAIEDDARVIANVLHASVGNERAFLAKETIARYLPDALKKYFEATRGISNAPETAFADTLLSELRALRDGLGVVKDAVLAEYDANKGVYERFIRERFQ